jgi:hypothetical protein
VDTLHRGGRDTLRLVSTSLISYSHLAVHTRIPSRRPQHIGVRHPSFLRRVRLSVAFVLCSCPSPSSLNSERTVRSSAPTRELLLGALTLTRNAIAVVNL